ncbi:hypothetical protein [Streptacidiphilus rugosus]|uniref:hypothetical protein n=1 Tax=Streptacidiphilus rugosus TaxID=405783 RepID=UPI00055B0735|nr:hypothetical protein [Streptacidiphilus rugosus]
MEGDEFAAALLERIRQARSALAAAAASTDSIAVAECLDELERALLLARENGIDVPAVINGPDARDGS